MHGVNGHDAGLVVAGVVVVVAWHTQYGQPASTRHDAALPPGQLQAVKGHAAGLTGACVGAVVTASAVGATAVVAAGVVAAAVVAAAVVATATHMQMLHPWASM